MKKIAVAALALVAAGAAMAEVTSANTVGYTTNLQAAQGFNFVAVPFVQIGYNTADIQQIQLDDGGQESIGWGEENFALWEGTPDVVTGTGFMYWDDGNGGYYWESSGGDQEFSIDPGQAVVIECAEGLTFKFSGQVSDADAQLTTAQGFNFFGNPFAASIDIQDVQLSDGGQESIGWGEENFALWEGTPDVVTGTGFMYWDDGNGGYYWENSSGGQEFTIPAGQGFALECAADLTVTIASPYTL